MADIPVLTAEVSVCFDPEIDPPPRGETIWVVGPGNVGYKGLWYDGAIAWAYLPKLPQSVKARLRKLQEEQQERERVREHKGHPLIQEEE